MNIYLHSASKGQHCSDFHPEWCCHWVRVELPWCLQSRSFGRPPPNWLFWHGAGPTPGQAMKCTHQRGRERGGGDEAKLPPTNANNINNDKRKKNNTVTRAIQIKCQNFWKLYMGHKHGAMQAWHTRNNKTPNYNKWASYSVPAIVTELSDPLHDHILQLCPFGVDPHFQRATVEEDSHITIVNVSHGRIVQDSIGLHCAERNTQVKPGDKRCANSKSWKQIWINSPWQRTRGTRLPPPPPPLHTHARTHARTHTINHLLISEQSFNARPDIKTAFTVEALAVVKHRRRSVRTRHHWRNGV